MSDQDDTESFLRKVHQQFQNEVNAVVDDWKSGKVITKLEALLSDSDQQWVSYFVDAAKEFYRGEHFQFTLEKDSKSKIYNNELDRHYAPLFSEYSLLINSLAFNSPASSREHDNSDGLLLYLRLDNKRNPQIVQIDR